MGSEWKQLTIGDVCYVTDGAHTKVDRVEHGVMYLTSKNIGAGELKLDSFDYIKQSDFERLFTDTNKSQRKLKTGDVLMGIIGTFGNCYIYKDTDKFGISSSIAILRANPEAILPEYLYFVISSNSFLQIVEKYKGGSVQGYTNIATIKALPISVPSLETQQRIVKQLIPLNLKITLNRQINQTLEQMAQTLFKSWFVDFDPVIDNALDAGNDIPDTLQERAEQRRLLRVKADFKPLPAETRALFPSEFEDSELGWVPKGWEGVSIANMCDMVTNGGTPNRATKEFWKDGDIPWYKTGEFSDGFLLTPSERITHAAIAGSSVKLLPENSVLMAIYAAPTVGRLGVLTETSAFNQACTGMVPKAAIGTWFLFLTLYFARDWFNNRANGAAQQNISKAIVENYLAIVPSQDVLTLFNKNMEDLFAKIRFNSEQIQRLSILRDTLLPKLISGELELDALPEAPELAEAR